LHHACENGYTDDVIQFLVDSWPESVQILTKKGLLPLHCAMTTIKWDTFALEDVEASLSLEAIQFLVQAWPDAVHEQDGHGCVPLHYACKNDCTDDVTQLLVEGWPMSLCSKTKFGTLLLHLVVNAKTSLETI